MFAIPRTSGWIAQWLEMIDDSEQKIARPRQIYTGERGARVRAGRRPELAHRTPGASVVVCNRCSTSSQTAPGCGSGRSSPPTSRASTVAMARLARESIRRRFLAAKPSLSARRAALPDRGRRLAPHRAGRGARRRTRTGSSAVARCVRLEPGGTDGRVRDRRRRRAAGPRARQRARAARSPTPPCAAGIRRFVATTLADNDAVTRLIEGFADPLRAARSGPAACARSSPTSAAASGSPPDPGPPVKRPRATADDVAVAHNRSLRALLVDVGTGAAVRDRRRARRAPAGRVHADHVAGTDALSAALARRGWDVVIYGGEGARPGAGAQGHGARADGRPAAAVRRRGAVRAPGRPLRLRPGLRARRDLRARPRARCPRCSSRCSQRSRARRRATTPTGCCSPSRRSPTTSPPASSPTSCARACSPRSARRSAGPTAPSGARRASPSMLRCTALWHDPAAGPQVAAFAEVSRRVAIAPGRGAARPRVRVPPARLGGRRARRRQHAAPRRTRCAPG